MTPDHRDDPATPEASSVREQLERLHQSAVFEKSDRLMAFLRHIVEAVLRGEARYLTESAVGNAVYGQTREYDARIDSTVRVEARRLRRKLTEYYAGPGKSDDVIISLPVGSYIPSLQRAERASPEADSARADDAQPIFRKGTGAAIAVLPFRAFSTDTGEESFAVGLSDELAFNLARAPGLRVVARSAIAQAVARDLSVPALAAEFGLDALLQGSVRIEGGQMRVTLEVADPKGFIVWSDRMRLPDGERLRLQELTAATMLSRLRLDSSQMRAKQIGPGPDALDALGKVYSSRQLLDEQTPASLLQALEQFKQLAASAPDYARGHSGIADCYCDMYRLGLIDQATAQRQAKAAALRALAIDPRSNEARGALGTVCGWLEWNRFEAEEHFRAALARGENSRAARAYAVLLTLLGRADEADHMLWEARQMEPFSIQQDIAETLTRYQSRRFADAIGTLARVQASKVANEALVYVALSHIFGGDKEGARQILPQIDRRIVKHLDLKHALAELQAWLGESEPAKALLASDRSDETYFARATLAAAVQDDERTFDALSKSIARRELSAVWVRSDVRFDRLRGTSRFEALIGELDRASLQRFAPATR
ncbi:hypothetical protein ACFPN2_33450 [Steroidobacter flavus]|uniref:Adenylate cyclase n=1 Tax=Steroidobacter flavus TaxID=1842136 RepID=A0ABV8T2D6_9GAMM